LYGIKPEAAVALAPLVEIAFDSAERSPDRIRAASELAKYSEVPTRSIEYAGGNNGPDLEVVVLGAIGIEEPAIVEGDYTEQVAAAPASGTPLELPYDGREEGS
jgi:hypothetical protein